MNVQTPSFAYMKVQVFERHFTIDKTLHKSGITLSVTPDELSDLIAC